KNKKNLNQERLIGIPSEVELLAEEEGSHDGDEEGLHGLVDGHEHGAAAVDAPRLHGEGDARGDESGVEDGEELGAGADGPGGGVALQERGDGEELDEAEEAGV
ncbi:Os02g0114150, partial [Oryza sativa Japonica Group]